MHGDRERRLPLERCPAQCFRQPEFLAGGLVPSDSLVSEPLHIFGSVTKAISTAFRICRALPRRSHCRLGLSSAGRTVR